jgi:alpha-mannosidase
LNHFARISNKTCGIVLSNRDAYFMKTGKSRVDSLDWSTAQISVLAGGQIDADINLGIPSQDGDSYFEDFFAVRTFTGNANATQSMKFALEHQNGPVAGKVLGGKAYPAKTFSLLSVSDPDVLLWTVKPAEEGIGAGIVIRFWDLEDENRNCMVSSPYPFKSVRTITHIENDREPLSCEDGKMNMQVGYKRLQSFRVFMNK